MNDPRGIPPIGDRTHFSTSDGRLWSLRLEEAGVATDRPGGFTPPVAAAPPVAAVKPLKILKPAKTILPAHSKVQVPPAPAAPANWSVFDHPTIGGRMTACVLMYGDYHDLHRRCLDALLGTTVPERVAVRVATNAVCAQTADYLHTLWVQGRLEKIYENAENLKKYPVQRNMYHDTADPIVDKWLFWFDDDSICLRPDWAPMIAELIVKHAPEGYHQYGPHYFYNLSASQISTIKDCVWYHGKPFRTKQGQPAPNGNVAHFATGSAYAISLEAVRACDIPEKSLVHNGGDVLTGEQLYQGGYRLKNVANLKNYIHWSSVKRRGADETHWGRK